MIIFKLHFFIFKVLILIIIICISSLGNKHTYTDLIKSIPNDFLFNPTLKKEFSNLSLSKNVAEKISKYLLETHTNYIIEDRKEEMTNREIEISDLQMKFFYKTFGFNIYGLISLIPQIAIDIRRIKDFGKDWKWIFINLVPIIGWVIWWLWMGFGKSGRGKENFI